MDPQDYVEVSLLEVPIEHTIKTEPLLEEDLPETFVTSCYQEEDILLEDPLQPTLHNRVLDSQAKLMLLNVVKFFQKFRLARARETGEDMNVNKVAAEATGVSESAVKNLLKQYRTEGIEKAIKPPTRRRVRKRKIDIAVEVKGAPSTTTTKKQRKK